MSAAVTAQNISLETPIGWLREHPRAVQAVIVALATFVLAYFSLILNQFSGNVTVVWLPNAMVLALIAMRQRLDLPIALGGHAAGVLLANILFGTSIWLSVGFTIVNSAEVGFAYVLFHRFLRANWPHATERHYLLFLSAVCLPPAILSALVGGALLSAAYGLDFVSAAIAWALGEAICISAFFPLFLWLISGSKRHLSTSSQQIFWILAAVLAIFVMLIVTPFFNLEVVGFMALITLLMLLSLKLDRVGTIFVTATLVLIISLSSYIQREVLDFQSAINLGTEVYSFLFVFACTSLPINIVTTLIERLRIAETTQRDIAALKSQFIATMSHEIKTPMNAIHGMFELFNMSELTDRQRKWSNAGLSASRNLQLQVTQILEMARLQENAVSVQLTSASLATLMSNWLVAIEAHVHSTGKPITVTSHIDKALPANLMIDPLRLQQIMSNLLNNAVKFTESGSIEIEAHREQDMLCISVSDTGIGIAPENLDSVFERFWQVDAGTNRRLGGTGLGLSISRDLANMCGGAIYVASGIDKGSRFVLTLPLVPAKDPPQQEQ